MDTAARDGLMDTAAWDDLYAEPLDSRYKGLPLRADPASLRAADARDSRLLDGLVPLGAIAAPRWHLYEDLIPPVLVLRASALDHNLAAMAGYCADHGVDLAPHGKTTMAPQLFRRQLAAGAWGITAATASHVALYRRFGVQRVLLANQLVDAEALRWLAGQLRDDEDFEFLCLVDSLHGVGLMDRALDTAGATRPVGVLVEVGRPGGRTGCRDLAAVEAVATAVAAADHLELRGVEGFEGLIPGKTLAATLAAVDGFLTEVRQVAVALDRAGRFDHLDRVVLTAGGSSFFDRVVEAFTATELSRPTQVILRSGCYITHDAEMYEGASPLAGRAPAGSPRLREALELWATVLSRPEPELAIVGFGKRDAAYDYRLPVVQAVRSADGSLRQADAGMRVEELNDQHAYVRVPSHDPVAVGDLVCCGISHPCAAFDKWRLIPVVDDDDVVVDGILTFF